MSRTATLFVTRTFTPVVTLETVPGRLLEGLDPNCFSADARRLYDILTPTLIWAKNAGECLELLEPKIQAKAFRQCPFNRSRGIQGLVRRPSIGSNNSNSQKDTWADQARCEAG